MRVCYTYISHTSEAHTYKLCFFKQMLHAGVAHPYEAFLFFKQILQTSVAHPYKTFFLRPNSYNYFLYYIRCSHSKNLVSYLKNIGVLAFPPNVIFALAINLTRHNGSKSNILLLYPWLNKLTLQIHINSLVNRATFLPNFPSFPSEYSNIS